MAKLNVIKGGRDALLEEAPDLLFRHICLGDEQARRELETLDARLASRAKLDVVHEMAEREGDTVNRRASIT